jgi:hypothetical protein
VENETFSGPLGFTDPIIEDDTDGKTDGELGVLHRLVVSGLIQQSCIQPELLSMPELKIGILEKPSKKT